MGGICTGDKKAHTDGIGLMPKCCTERQSESNYILFVCVEVLRPSQLNGVMPSVVSLPNHTSTGQA